MPKLIVNLGQNGTKHPLDGEYECRLDNFNLAELHEIKRISGVRGGEIAEALIAGDTDLVLAIAVVILRREGRSPDVESLWQTEAGGIILQVFDDEPGEDEGDPPDGPPSDNESPGGNTGESESSG